MEQSTDAVAALSGTRADAPQAPWRATQLPICTEFRVQSERSKTLHSISIGEFDALTNSIRGLQSEEIEATEVIDHATNTASVNAKLVSPPSVNLEIFCQNVQQAPMI